MVGLSILAMRFCRRQRRQIPCSARSSSGRRSPRRWSACRRDLMTKPRASCAGGPAGGPSRQPGGSGIGGGSVCCWPSMSSRLGFRAQCWRRSALHAGRGAVPRCAGHIGWTRAELLAARACARSVAFHALAPRHLALLIMVYRSRRAPDRGRPYPTNGMRARSVALVNGVAGGVAAVGRDVGGLCTTGWTTSAPTACSAVGRPGGSRHGTSAKHARVFKVFVLGYQP